MNKIRFNTRTGFILIDPEEVVYCEADCNYTKIFLVNKTSETVSVTLGKVEELVPDSLFLRISRKNIINVNFLHNVDRKRMKCNLKTGTSEFALHIPSKNINYVENFLLR